MRMSIDEALNLLNNSKPKSNNAFSIQMNEAINVIGITIRKYQKLKQTLDIIFALGDENPRRTVKISELREALEDGEDGKIN